MKKIKISYLDHVAIRVKNIERSADWYENVFGFTRNQFKEWGPFPIFMQAGKTGVALFPANEKDPTLNPKSQNVKIDHFAFNVDRDNFEVAKERLNELKLEYTLQNHYYFESLYINDPDGHCVELTTILVKEDDFYK